MDVDTKENGSRTIWKGWVSTFGTMEECTRANTKTIKSTDTESTLGQMDVVTKDIGSEVNSTALEHTSFLRMAK